MSVASNFFEIIFGLSAGASQSELMQKIKSRGDDVIQTSRGLCIKTSLNTEGLKELLSGQADASAASQEGIDIGVPGVKVEPINTSDTQACEQLSQDIRAFLGLGDSAR